MLTSDLGLDFVGVLPGELLLSGGGDEDVAGGLQQAALIGLGVGEAHDGTVLLGRDEGTGVTLGAFQEMSILYNMLYKSHVDIICR